MHPHVFGHVYPYMGLYARSYETFTRPCPQTQLQVCYFSKTDQPDSRDWSDSETNSTEDIYNPESSPIPTSMGYKTSD